MQRCSRRVPEAGLTSPPCVLEPPQFIRLRGELGSVCDRRTKPMLMIIIKSFLMLLGWGWGRNWFALVGFDVVPQRWSQGWVGPALESIPASMPMFCPSLHFGQGLRPLQMRGSWKHGRLLGKGKGRLGSLTQWKRISLPTGPTGELCLKRLQVVRLELFLFLLDMPVPLPSPLRLPWEGGSDCAP